MDPEGRAFTGSLKWAIRPSLVDYVLGTASGTLETRGGATYEAGRFVFPLSRVIEVSGEFGLAFSGAVILKGHFGALHIEITSPEMVLEERGCVLLAHTDGSGAEPLAVGPATASSTAGAITRWDEISLRLVPSAVGVFGGVYPAGADLAPASIRLSSLTDDGE